MLLLESVWQGDLHQVQRHLEKDARFVNVVAFGGLTPLGVACYRGHAEVVDCLLENGADPAALNLRGSVMKLFDKFMTDLERLQAAAGMANERGVENENEDNSEDFEAPLHVACRRGHASVVRRLVQEAVVNVNQLTQRRQLAPLYLAAQHGHCPVVQVLLGKCANANYVHAASGDTALTAASAHGQAHCVRLLVQQGGANVNAQNRRGLTSLDRALRLKHRDLVCTLVQHGARVQDASDADGWTALHFALAWKDTALIDQLLHQLLLLSTSPMQGTTRTTSGLYLNTTNHAGVTPLHSACTVGSSVDVVQRLLRAGAHVHARDHQNWTPVHRACYHGHYDLVNVLLYPNGKEEKGKSLVDPMAKKALETQCHVSGTTPLGYAIQKQHKKIARLLLRAGANVNVQDQEGWTPLHLAIKYCPQLVSDLLQAGAAANAVTNSGSNAVHLAVIYIANGKNGDDEHDDKNKATYEKKNTMKRGTKESKHEKEKDIDETTTTITRIIGQLLERGADGTAVDQTAKQWTPLQYAVETGRFDVVKLLLLHWIVSSSACHPPPPMLSC